MSQAQTRAEVPSSAKPRPMVIGTVLVLGHAIKHIFNSGFFVVVPELQSSLGLSNSAIGTLSTIRNVGGGLANAPAGYLADRFSDRWAMILGIAMLGVGVFHFLMGIANTYWLLVAAATLGFVSSDFWHPPAIAALSQKFASRRGFAIALHGMGGSIGEAIGPITVGALLGLFLWTTVLQASLAPALAAAVPTWLVLRGLRGDSGKPDSFRTYLTSVYQLISNRVLVAILAVTVGFVSIQAIVMTFLPIYLRVDLGYSSLTMSAYISAAQVLGIVSQPVLGLLSDRFSRRVVILPSLVCLGIAVLAVPLVGSGFPLLLAVGGMGIFLFPLMSILLAAAMDVARGDVPATTISLMFGAATVFSSGAPALAGVLADAYNVKAIFLLAAGIAFVTAGFTAVHSLSR